MAKGSGRSARSGGAKRWDKKAPTLANVRASDADVARWKRAWDHPPQRLYLGWIDPFPMPPKEPCRPCGGGIRFWTEQDLPHRGWRCCNCHPAPATVQIRHWTIDDPVDAAERDAIAAEAPERQPRPAQGGVWLDEITEESK